MPQHSKEHILARRQQVGQLYLSGHFQTEIGQRVGVSQQQISADLAVLRKEWRASALRDFDEMKAQELAKVDKVEREFWACYERSLLPSERSTRHARVKDPTDGTALRTVTLHQEGRTGDGRYLDGVLRCIERRCKILGVDAPQKIAPTSPDGSERYNPTETLEAVAHLLGISLPEIEGLTELALNGASPTTEDTMPYE